MQLINNYIMLRAIEPEDNELLRYMLNSPEIEGLVGGWSFPVSKEQQMQWYRQNYADSHNVRYVIEYNGSAVGMASIININWKDKNGEISIKLANKEERGKGIGKNTINLLLKYAFEELNLQCIMATVLEYNKASEKMFLNCGFTQEGILRQRIFKGGKYHDQIQLSILKEEYIDEPNR